MSIFQCEKCGCGENTACGRYHTRNMDIWPDDELKGLALCSACSPTHYKDGEVNKKGGEWHGKWNRVFYPKGAMSTNHEGNLIHTESGKYAHECGLGRDTEYET